VCSSASCGTAAVPPTRVSDPLVARHSAVNAVHQSWCCNCLAHSNSGGSSDAVHLQPHV
jgi:hypothetical protein